MKDFPKTYDPSPTEKKWSAFWEEKGFFHADPNSGKKPYSIVLPPPNVTGILHMGHALVDTLQDILIRFRRMKGDEVLWVPGTDHAGISTQTVVEKNLIKKTGKRRKDFSREEFLSHVWKWKEEHEGHIIAQLKKLGCSCDWKRQRFTMDEKANFSTASLFKKMFDNGLIYQGDYLVNWDPITQTALADDEVEYEEKKSHLWYISYPLEDGKGHLTVATTRPETMLGDVAVAISPKDERYASFIGKNLILPITNRIIPVIADHFVDPKFGTGVVKITPAHDPNDYEMGMRHNLPLINILNPDGTINEKGLEFEGLSTYDARLKIVQKLKELNVLEKTEPHIHRVGISYRSKAIIEPYLSKQWFIKMAPFKEKLINAVKSGKVKLIPKNWEKTYFHWIENLRDWCISRQLWWGHRIPIWYNKEDPTKIICHVGENPPDPKKWVQDEDVLDTWFSSALWPFSALGWPEKTDDLQAFYPNATLITGHDILFFWVARMIMMGEYVMGEVPFKETALLGLIYGKSYWRENKEGGITYVSLEEKKAFDLGAPIPSDVSSKWEKMSKSKGNVIDPLEMIASYGTDAIRMALSASATQSRQIDLDRRRFEEFKNFTNKIWNGSRFVITNLNLTSKELMEGIDSSLLTLEDKWVFSRLNQVIVSMNNHLNAYHFDRAAMESYTFFWDEFCAYYVEMVKPVLFGKIGDEKLRKNKQKILLSLLSNSLRLMHPIAPFVTEEIFGLLKQNFPSLEQTSKDPYTNETVKAFLSPACTVAPYPELISKEAIDPDIEKTFQFICKIVYAIRNIRSEMQLAPNTATDLILEGENFSLEIIKENQLILSSLVRLKSIHFNSNLELNQFHSSALVEEIKIILPLPKEMQDKEKKRLKKEQEKVVIKINSLQKQLTNPNFTEKAPQELVEKTKQTLSDLQKKLSEIEEKIKL